MNNTHDDHNKQRIFEIAEQFLKRNDSHQLFYAKYANHLHTSKKLDYYYLTTFSQKEKKDNNKMHKLAADSAAATAAMQQLKAKLSGVF